MASESIDVPNNDSLIKEVQSGASVTTRTQMFVAHNGPLPAPDDFAFYNSVLPGAAERLMRMAELEQQNRHEDMRQHAKNMIKYVHGNIWNDRLGMIFGFCVAGLCLAAAVYCAVINQPWLGAACVAGTFISPLATIFARKKPPEPDE